MRLLISNASIVDGTGAPARRGDVLVEDGFVAEVDGTSLAPDQAIDARGMVVAPGFIDVHSHGDFTLPGDPGASAKLMQGVTTEVVGNCGLGVFPADERVEKLYGMMAPLIFGERHAHCFRDLTEYRAHLEGKGIAVNAAPLVAHGNVRCLEVGLEERPVNDAELERMRQTLAAAMEQGAFGLSTGLVYPPGAYASTEEVVELAKVSARHGGIYATHVRDEGGKLVESMEEALRIGRDAKVSVQLSHHKAAGRFNWGKVKKTLAMVDAARTAGVDVHSDVYPYTAGSTVLAAMFLPLWAFEGSHERLMERLRDPHDRKRMIADSKARMIKYVDLPGVLDRIVPKQLLLPFLLRELSKLVIVSSTKKQHRYEGMTLRAIVTERKQDLFEGLLDVLAEEELAVAAIAHVMHEDDVQRVMAHPHTMIGTDGFPQKEGKPHPRTFGTYPRVLERYVRELGLFSLETAIHKMTGMVASKLGIADRGVIRPGARADLVMFDPASVRDRSTYANPRNHPEGIAHVFVNGAWAVKDGVATDARAGRVLSRRAS